MEKGSLFFVIREGRRRSDSSTAHSSFLFFLFLGRFNTTIEGGERKCVLRWKRDLPFDCDGDRRTHVWMPLTQEEGESHHRFLSQIKKVENFHHRMWTPPPGQQVSPVQEATRGERKGEKMPLSFSFPPLVRGEKENPFPYSGGDILRWQSLKGEKVLHIPSPLSSKF